MVLLTIDEQYLIELLYKSPLIFIIVVFAIIIIVLWKENKKKDNSIYKLAENVVKVASIYEERIKDVKIQSELHNSQHIEIINLLKDVKRALKIEK